MEVCYGFWFDLVVFKLVIFFIINGFNLIVFFNGKLLFNFVVVGVKLVKLRILLVKIG